MPAPIILVPGFWLGAWAYDEVAATLRADGHDVTALTLPGLESADTDRSKVTFEDHVNAIVDAVREADAPVVLAVHSATGFSGYAASDIVPERIAAMVYVDSAPGVGRPGSTISKASRSRCRSRRSRPRRTSTASATSRSPSSRVAASPSPPA